MTGEGLDCSVYHACYYCSFRRGAALWAEFSGNPPKPAAHFRKDIRRLVIFSGINRLGGQTLRWKNCLCRHCCHVRECSNTASMQRGVVICVQHG